MLNIVNKHMFEELAKQVTCEVANPPTLWGIGVWKICFVALRLGGECEGEGGDIGESNDHSHASAPTAIPGRPQPYQRARSGRTLGPLHFE